MGTCLKYFKCRCRVYSFDNTHTSSSSFCCPEALSHTSLRIHLVSPTIHRDGKPFAGAFLQFIICPLCLAHHLLWLSDNAINNGVSASTRRQGSLRRSTGPCECTFPSNIAEWNIDQALLICVACIPPRQPFPLVLDPAKRARLLPWPHLCLPDCHRLHDSEL